VHAETLLCKVYRIKNNKTTHNKELYYVISKFFSQEYLSYSHSEAVCQPNVCIILMPCTRIVDNSQGDDRRVGFMAKNYHTILNTSQLHTAKSRASTIKLHMHTVRSISQLHICHYYCTTSKQEDGL